MTRDEQRHDDMRRIVGGHRDAPPATAEHVTCLHADTERLMRERDTAVGVALAVASAIDSAHDRSIDLCGKITAFQEKRL